MAGVADKQKPLHLACSMKELNAKVSAHKLQGNSVKMWVPFLSPLLSCSLVSDVRVRREMAGEGGGNELTFSDERKVYLTYALLILFLLFCSSTPVIVQVGSLFRAAVSHCQRQAD